MILTYPLASFEMKINGTKTYSWYSWSL